MYFRHKQETKTAHLPQPLQTIWPSLFFSNWAVLAFLCCCLKAQFGFSHLLDPLHRCERTVPFSTWSTCLYPKAAHRQLPSSSCPSDKGLGRHISRLYQRGGSQPFQWVCFPRNFYCSVEDLERIDIGYYNYHWPVFLVLKYWRKVLFTILCFFLFKRI